MLKNYMKARCGIVRSAVIAMCLLSMALTTAQSQAPASSHDQDLVFRSPFLLRLHIDDEHYYEQHFDRVPYVSHGEVYLFAGEDFGVNVRLAGDQVVQLTYQPDPAKADVEFKFTQEKSATGLMMLLMIKNKLPRRLFLDAFMTVPDKKEAYKTSVLPIQAGLSSFESWPHPIVQLVLGNLRLAENGSGQ